MITSNAVYSINSLMQKNNYGKIVFSVLCQNIIHILPQLNVVIDTPNIACPNLKSELMEHLDSLCEEFSKYFLEISAESWQSKLIRSPCVININELAEIV